MSSDGKIFLFINGVAFTKTDIEKYVTEKALWVVFKGGRSPATTRILISTVEGAKDHVTLMFMVVLHNSLKFLARIESFGAEVQVMANALKLTAGGKKRVVGKKDMNTIGQVMSAFPDIGALVANDSATKRAPVGGWKFNGSEANPAFMYFPSAYLIVASAGDNPADTKTIQLFFTISQSVYIATRAVLQTGTAPTASKIIEARKKQMTFMDLQKKSFSDLDKQNLAKVIGFNKSAWITKISTWLTTKSIATVEDIKTDANEVLTNYAADFGWVQV